MIKTQNINNKFLILSQVYTILMRELISCCTRRHHQRPEITKILHLQSVFQIKKMATAIINVSIACVLLTKIKIKRLNKISNLSFINFKSNSNTLKFKLICLKESKWTSIKRINNSSSYKDKIKFLKIKYLT